MPDSRSRNTHGMDRENDPNKMIYITGLAAGTLFALGYWAVLLIAVLTSDFTFSGLLITVLASVSAGLGIVGWRRRQVALSWGALVLLLAAMALSRGVSG
ncbi:MAG TPA: hypothetical protein VFY14_02585 [Streptomyces sp.]|nr:hypothetical protein [Streptomyces sp.]